MGVKHNMHNPHETRFSVGSWSFHELFEAGKIDVFGYLQAMKYRYHLRDVDIWTGMLSSTDNGYIEKIAQTLDEEAIRVACLATDAQVWSDSEEERRANRLAIVRWMEIAKRLKVETLRVDLGLPTPHPTPSQFLYIRDAYRDYAAMAAEAGFRVGPQTHQPATQVPDNVVRLAEEVGLAGFGVVIDVARWTEDVDNGDARCAPYAMLLHFDSSRIADFAMLRSQVDVFASAGYTGCWSLEYRLGGSEYLGVAADLGALQRAVHLARG